MIIKRFQIGSDDDDFTLNSLIGIPSVLPHVSLTDPLKCIHAYEAQRDDMQITDHLEEFQDSDYWSVAYEHGFKTFMSMSHGESNELVYLINMEAHI